MPAVPSRPLVSDAVHDALDLLPDGVLVLDADWRVLHVNAAFLEGVETTREAMLGRTLWEAVPTAEHSTLAQLYRQAMRERRALSTEAYHPVLQRWFEARAVPRPDGGLAVVVRPRERAPEQPAPGEQTRARLEVLQQLTAELAATLERDAVVSLVMGRAMDALGAVAGSLGLVRDDGATLDLVGFRGIRQDLHERFRSVPADPSTPVGQAFHAGEPVWVRSVEAFDAAYPSVAGMLSGHGGTCLAALPLQAGAARFGALVLLFGTPQAFEPADRAFLESFAHQAALALERARLLEREAAARAQAEAGEARFQALVRSELLGVVESSLTGGVRAANDAFLRIVGRTREELEAGRLRWKELTPPEWAFADARAVEDLAARGYAAPYEKEYVRPDGVRVPVLLSAVLLAPGHTVTLVLDLTERKRAERDLTFLAHASTLLGASFDYEGAVQGLAELVVPALADWCAVDLLQPDGRLRRLGVAHTDPAKVRYARELFERYPPRPEEQHGVVQVARSGQSEWAADIPEELLALGAHDAEHLRLALALGLRSFVIVPLVSRGRSLGALSLVHAESGRRYSQKDVQLAEELARRAALFIDNARLFQEAQAAVRLRDEFLGIASHELKTPLTPLALKLQALERAAAHHAGHPLAERVGADVQLARRQVRRLNDLVTDLLDVSRITAGRLSLTLEDVDLHALVQELVERFRPEALRGGTPLELELVPGTAVVGRWDRARLEQVAVNLLSNALKYGASHPVEVRVGPAEAPGRVRLEVHDRGIGIAPADLARIFERFERAVSDRHYGGLGLGLYITRQIVHALGGEVHVDSRPGEGSRFWVDLPLAGP